MTAMKTRFDGKQIVVPAELEGASAQDVVVVISEGAFSGATQSLPRAKSIFDVPRAEGQGRTAEQIVAEVREGRDGGDDR